MNLINNFYLNISIIFLIFIFILNIIISDINKKEINIIIFTNIIVQSLFNIFIPLFFISGCYLFNFIYIKAFRLTIVFLLGSLAGIILFKKHKLTVLDKLLKNECIYLTKNLRVGLYSSFLLTSFILIISGLILGDLYYNKTFSRIYNYYNWFLITPVLLFEFSKNKLKDLKLLAIAHFLHGLVLFFGYGRTTNAVLVIVFSIFVFMISTSKNLNFKELLIIPFKNFRAKIITSTMLFIFFSIARAKFLEITENVKQYSEEIPTAMAYFLHASLAFGFPLMNTWHMINAEKIESKNIVLTATFWELITEIPLFGAIFRDTEIKSWVTKLPENLLGLNHQDELGGYTFGSDFAFYSYGNVFWSYSVSFIISLLNMYMIYLLANNLSSIIKSYFIKENVSLINYSARPTIFLISNIGISSIIQNELFFSLITLAPFYLMGRYFVKK